VSVVIGSPSRGSPARGDIAALLDVGSSKVACLIVAREPGQPGRPELPVRVLGFGHQRSRGIKAGVVVDLEEAEQAIRAAVGQAERMAGFNVEEVIVAVACGRLKSTSFAASARLDGRRIADGDLARVLAAGRAYAERDGRRLVHLGRLAYRLDGQATIRDPRGMTGGRLDADLHAITADEGPLRNLVHAIERAYLTVSGLVAAPLAAGLSATSPEERRLGVGLVDMGAGATTLSLFADGHLLHTDALAVGGGHISFDIARALATPLAEAERIKTLYGNMLGAASDEHEMIAFPAAGEEQSQYQTSKARLRMIIGPRVQQILDLVRERLARTPLGSYAGGRVVLTGGASQLAGLAEIAANRLGRPVRIGRPGPLGGLPHGVCSPAFSTVIGLAGALFEPDACLSALHEREVLGSGAAGYLERVGQWVRESF
jgi:cell division protein FtsA